MMKYFRIRHDQPTTQLERALMSIVEREGAELIHYTGFDEHGKPVGKAFYKIKPNDEKTK